MDHISDLVDYPSDKTEGGVESCFWRNLIIIILILYLYVYVVFIKDSSEVSDKSKGLPTGYAY